MYLLDPSTRYIVTLFILFKGIMFGYIYLTINKLNGKKYIGQKTSSVFLKEEYLGSGKLLSKAIDKYGKENFEVILLEEVEASKSELNEREIYWIKILNAVESDEFYNLHPGGVGGATYGNLGHKASKETCELFRDIQLKRYENNPEYRAHMSNVHKGQVSPRKGKHLTEETKQKISVACKGKPSPRKGVKLSPSQREAHSKNMRDRHFWNNGKETRLVHECPGEGWVRGRLPYEGGPVKDPVTGKFIKKDVNNEIQ